MASKPDPELELIKDIAGFTHDPLGHVLYAYPWGSDVLPASGPRVWQAETLTTIGDHLSNPQTRFVPLRIGIASGHGIGKSALIAMIAKWGLDTCEDCKIVVTANTEPQLRTKTIPEITKWANLSLTAHWFRITASSVSSNESNHEKSWRLDAVTWSKDNTEAFAGLHNLLKRIVVIYDEASGIDDKVWEVTLGALTDEETEIIWIAFGNPTKNTGGFRNCFGKGRNLWKTKQIDSRTVEGTNKAYLQELIDTYGLSSDIVKVRVLGQFPSASSLQLIPSAYVDAAQTADFPAIASDPVIFGVDHARFGDDHSTLAIRCGRDARSRPWKRWYGADSMQIAGDIAIEAEIYKPDAIFVDAGGPNAGGVIDRLRQLGIENVWEINFGGHARQAIWDGEVRIACANKRAEMWLNMRAWLKRGAIPVHQGLYDDLVGVEYGYGADQTTITLEKKEHMKARGLASPDDGDALALTFAEPVQPRAVPGYLDPANYGTQRDYDRYAELD